MLQEKFKRKENGAGAKGGVIKTSKKSSQPSCPIVSVGEQRGKRGKRRAFDGVTITKKSKANQTQFGCWRF